MAVRAPPEIFWRYFPVAEFIERASAAGRGLPGQWTSYWRSVPQNRAVGGHRWSQHLVGLAADHSPSSAAFRHAAAVNGLFAIPEGDHDHVQGWNNGVLESLFR